MQKIWERYPNLTDAVRKRHIQAKMHRSGHAFDHPFQVGQLALIIGGPIAGAAGLCHNADRIIQHERGLGQKKVPDAPIVEIIDPWLATENFSATEKEIITDAVLKHSRLNEDDDSPVLIVLKDADRVGCSMADCIMATSRGYPDLPVIDPVHFLNAPGTDTYSNPGSVMNNLSHRRKWMDPQSPSYIRSPKARELMQRRLDYFNGFINEVISQREEIGLVPYPFPD